MEVMKGLFPGKAKFLDHLIERVVDLEDVFKKAEYLLGLP
jgi:hypothetical protein|tara:strand:- start:251 stop:370 length:120 start_codon:yes stop_codon:yes gene_type:complete